MVTRCCDLLMVLDSELAVRESHPDFAALARHSKEDPVTGSAHTLLAPCWTKVLGKNNLHAFQVYK